jgi:hypothetical protein
MCLEVGGFIFYYKHVVMVYNSSIDFNNVYKSIHSWVTKKGKKNLRTFYS